jgi:periplasmic protein TonB
VTFKKFILFSITVHAAVLLFIYFMPAPKQQKPRELVATLVTPETPAPPPPAPKKPLPVPPALKKSPAPRMPHPRMRPAPPHIAVKPLPLPPELKPIVPGEGPITRGKTLPPPNVIPKGGRGGGEKVEKGAGKGMERYSKPGPSRYGKSFDLFDRGVTEEIARKDTGGAKQEEGGKDSPITMDTKNYLYAPYLSLLRQKIESIWVYPPEAAAKGLYGDLQIRFTIKKDGTLGAVELVRTSGYQMLDAAAIRALKDGAPYWPLPDSWGKKEYTILGHFVYNMYGYRIQ